jgi:hypothetical protein
MNKNQFIKEIEKTEIPYKIIEIKITPELKRIERDVRKFVMEIKEANKKAAKSKLRFDFGVKALN